MCEEHQCDAFKTLTVLLIDNYDSFTYNLYQYMCELGATVHVVRNDEITVEECAQYNADRIMLSPGPGTPDDAGITMRVIEAYAGKVPIFGVCLVRLQPVPGNHTREPCQATRMHVLYAHRPILYSQRFSVVVARDCGSMRRSLGPLLHFGATTFRCSPLALL